MSGLFLSLIKFSHAAIFMKPFPLFLFLISVVTASMATAATPLPTWVADPTTTRQGYEFNTGSLTPMANTLDNTNGVPMTTITLGVGSDGWQKPGNLPKPAVNATNGVTYDGAYDLGILGTIVSDIAFAPTAASPGTYYRVYFQLYTVDYEGITKVPDFFPNNLTVMDLAMTKVFVANDPRIGFATWQGLTWTGYFDNVTSNNLAFGIIAPNNNTSIIDTYEVFTRYEVIPETSTNLLALGSTLLLMAYRRRR